jgi:predicted transcriptional regulator
VLLVVEEVVEPAVAVWVLRVVDRLRVRQLALQWAADVASWVLVGDAEEYRMSEERRRIVELLNRVGEAMGPKAIASAAELNYGSVRVMLSQMVSDGLIASPERGKYIIINSVNNWLVVNVNGIGVPAVNYSRAESHIGKPNAGNVNDVHSFLRAKPRLRPSRYDTQS